MRYFKKICGERLYLSPINEEDAEIYAKWMNDYSVSSNLTMYAKVINLSFEREALKRLASQEHNYAIVLNRKETLIGNISLMDIDNINRTATLGLFIGEDDNRNQGYGSEALRLILNYGFQTLNLHNIMLFCYSDNEQALGCYKKAGFREFGRRREAKFKDGTYIDIIYMEILVSRFFGEEE